MIRPKYYFYFCVSQGVEIAWVHDEEIIQSVKNLALCANLCVIGRQCGYLIPSCLRPELLKDDAIVAKTTETKRHHISSSNECVLL